VEARKVDNTRRSSSRRTTPVLRRQPTKKRKKSTSWLWLSLMTVGALSAAGGALLAFSLSSTPFLHRQLSAAEASIFRQDNSFSRSTLQVPELAKPINILLLGIKTNLSDIRTGDGSARKQAGYDAVSDSLQGLSDTMMLIRFDPVSKRVIVFGIPRDTKVEMNGRSVKINSIDQESGIGQAAKMVSTTLQGVEIDKYVRMNNVGLEKLIDALGGVTLTVPKDMKYQDDAQHFYINLKAGKQHLDGNKLVGFLRFRKDANGDLGRMQRQQIAMRAMLDQWVNPMNVARIPQLMSIVRSHVDTNLNVEQIIALAGFASGPAKGKTQMMRMPGDYNGDGRHGTSYWLPDEAGIKNKMAQYFAHGEVDTTPIPPEKLRIKVQDTGYYPDATQRFIKTLEKAGYQQVSLDHDPKALKENLETTQITVQAGGSVVGEAIKEKIGLGTVEVDTSGDLYSDITIKLGKDWATKK
jgi:polyisoprenyl-teichoic acid--peptidoglycan teichoic acid transferase